MPSLNDLLAKAKLPTPSSIRNDLVGQARASIRSTSNEIRNIPAGIASSAINSAKGAVAGAISGGLSDVRGAVTKALHGDFSGALGQLQSGPQNVLKALGLNSGTGPGAAGGLSDVNPLQGALSRADPLMSFQWFCELPTVTPIGKTPVSLGWNYVEEATVPFRSFDTRQVWAQGRNRHYASSYNVDQLNLHLYADITGVSWAYLKAWQASILAPFSQAESITRGGGFGRPSDYQKVVKFYLLAPDMSQVIYLEYTECWPTNLDALHLDSNSSTRLTFNVNLSVGDVFTAVLGVNNNPMGNSLLSSLQTKVVNSVLNILT